LFLPASYQGKIETAIALSTPPPTKSDRRFYALAKNGYYYNKLTDLPNI
jgi:hypothetical protein